MMVSAHSSGGLNYAEVSREDENSLLKEYIIIRRLILDRRAATLALKSVLYAVGGNDKECVSSFGDHVDALGGKAPEARSSASPKNDAERLLKMYENYMKTQAGGADA